VDVLAESYIDVDLEEVLGDRASLRLEWVAIKNAVLGELAQAQIRVPHKVELSQNHVGEIAGEN